MVQVTYTIRDAREGDYEEIVELIKKSYKDEETPCKITLQDFKRDAHAGHFYCVVSEDSSFNLLGFALYCLTYSSRRGLSAYLEDVYVKINYRKQGIGSSLIRTVAKKAVERNCNQMKSACAEWNTVGLNLHKSLGGEDITDAETCHLVRFEKRALHQLAKY